ncbi:DNA primase [Agathobaculum sp. Marseille-P7918]|uniref:DNA primase n=1 Tax=Agathobaculum sp. Marseille-P7918 TaxID=2479843 RepID=UPI000F62E644|nr:DNA primase [Agathobaculum sp. Marseille-P7918]
MAFDRVFLDELSARNDIVDVVSQYVQLKKSGANYFGLCPFHNEKTPSFSVSPDKQIFHCFGCGAGGGVITFTMKAEGLEFPDAVRYLAARAGMQVPEQGEADRKAARHRERLYALCKDAARFYYDTLWKPENRVAQQYFLGRGLHRRTMNRFGLGYAPDSFHALLDAMTAKGYTRDEMLDAGLLSRSEKGHVYDRFRGRVMFPIIDVRGNVIAFGGRVLDDSKPKYLNSPETPIFHKSRNLFALNLSKTTKSGYFILAEGYMDVIALHQAGFDCAVASLGTSLTEEQARIIARHVGRIVISYDADGAGQSAAQRAIDILKKCDLQVKVLRIPGAKDPDEFIKAKGADAFRALIERSEDHNAYRLEQIAAKYDLEDDEARVQFLRDAARMLAGIESSIEREVYAGRAAKMAGVTAEAMNVEVRRELNIRKKKQKAAERREIRSPVGMAQPKDRTLAYADVKSAKAEENVLRLLFYDQKLAVGLEKELPPAWFSAPVLRKIYERVLALDREGQMVDILSFEGWLEANEMSLLSAILDQGIPPGEHRQEMQEYINTIRMQRVRDGTITEAGEDPLLTFGRIKKQNAGGQTI